MQLLIDNISVEPKEGETLLQIVKRIGLDSDSLKTKPLAAHMGGQTYTLLYVPLRKGTSADETKSIRRGIRASKGVISLLRYQDNLGYSVYERTMLFVFILAVRKLYPKATVKVNFAIGQGIVADIIKDQPLTDNDIEKIRKEYLKIVKEDYPLKRQRMDVLEAAEVFAEDGQTDKVRLLEWRPFSYFDVYAYKDYYDYFYGEMAPSTGYVSVFDIKRQENSAILIKPDYADPDKVAEYAPRPKLNKRFRISDDWNELMQCSVAADLNDIIRRGEIRQLIRVNEALHEKEFARIADNVVCRDAQAAMIAGPSSSGKTTSANRLCTQLRVHGKKPILMSLDDYYIDRDKVPLEPDGSMDLEHIRTIDVEFFAENLDSLLKGKETEIPRYDFLTQKRVMDGSRKMKLDKDTILVIEGIHGLNPVLLPSGIDKDRIYKLSVTALMTLNLDNHNRIQTTQMRMLRRIVRDYETRGASIERTLDMWGSVRRGEERWIFPFQEQADDIFDSALIYEPAVLKKHIYPILMNVRPDSPYYEEVESLMKFLNYFLDANVEDEIPPTSIIREFIGGNTFYV